VVVRGNLWFIRGNDYYGQPIRPFYFGRAGDRPLVGDWNYDGLCDIAVVRGNRWYVRDGTFNPGTSPPVRTFAYGRAGDTPLSFSPCGRRVP